MVGLRSAPINLGWVLQIYKRTGELLSIRPFRASGCAGRYNDEAAYHEAMAATELCTKYTVCWVCAARK